MGCLNVDIKKIKGLVAEVKVKLTSLTAKVDKTTEPINASVSKVCKTATAIAILIASHALHDVIVSKDSEPLSANIAMLSKPLEFDVTLCYSIGTIEEYEVFYVTDGVFLLSDGRNFEVVTKNGRI